MKVLLLTNKVPYPAKDGSAIASLSIAQGLRDLGHEVHIFSLNTKKHFTPKDELNQPALNGIKWHLSDIDTSINIIKAFDNLISSGLPYNLERFISEKATQNLKELLNTERFDIIQIEGLYMMPYLESIRESTHTKVIQRSHNMEHEIWERNAFDEKNRFKRWYFNKLSVRLRDYEIDALNGADAFIAITTRDLTRAQELKLKKPSIALPVGIQWDEEPAWHEPEEWNSMFYIGSMDWMPNQKGMDWFMRKVWDTFQQFFKDWKFYHAGRAMPQEFKDITKEGYYNLGEIPDAKALMRSKNIMIAPLFSGGGMRVKMVEAMGMGKCVIATDIAAEGIDGERGKHFWVGNSSQEFGKIMIELAKNPELVRETGRNAAEFAKQHFDNRRIVNELVKFYQTLLD